MSAYDVSPDWMARVHRAFDGFLDLTPSPGEAITWTRAQSRDGRTSVEFSAAGSQLVSARLEMRLPVHLDDLVSLQLGFWTLLFLQSLFPTWRGLNSWVESASAKVTSLGGWVEESLGNYRLRCQYDPSAHQMAFHVQAHAETCFPE